MEANRAQHTPQRPSRADEVRQERRRKPGATTVSGLKLHVDPSLKDQNYEYHWVNDVPGRIQQMYDNDWDRVESTEISDAVGTVPTKVVGTDGGKPMNAVLMKKRKDWYEADQQEKQKPLDEMDQAIRRGINHQRNEPELSGEVAYTPGGQNTISR